MAAGAGLAGGVIQGVAAKNAGDANAAILRSNATIADQAAGDARTRGQYAEGVAAMKGSQTEGLQTTQYAAAGVDVASGSAADVLSSTAMMSKLDQAVIENNAMRESWGYQNQARSLRNQASIAETGGKAQMIGGLLSGISSAARPIMSIIGSGGGGGDGWIAPTVNGANWYRDDGTASGA